MAVRPDPVGETEAERRKRRAQRLRFGSVAALYEATRQGYPSELIEVMLSTAGVGRGDPVLEIGCGTGQLTRQLIPFALVLTAIDISPEMVAVAQSHPGMVDVNLVVSAFEDFNAGEGDFSLIASATAFHWIDPDTGFAKVARLLRPGGWMAWLTIREVYDPPLGPALTDLYVARSDDAGAWTRRTPRTEADVLRGTGLFADPQVHTHAARTTLPAEVVLGVELTRATTLSYDTATRESFRQDLGHLLRGQDRVPVELQSRLTMAQLRTRPIDLQ